MLLLMPPALVAPAPQAAQVQDFDQAFRWMKANYAWAERFDWVGLRAAYRPRVLAAQDAQAFHRVMEDFLEEFADAHTHLGSNLSDSWRLPPGDIAAEWRGAEAVVLAVRPGSRAESAGIKAGLAVLSVDGQPLAEALRSRPPRFLKRVEEVDRNWMLNALLAGRRRAAMRLEFRDAAQRREVLIPEGPDPESPIPETRLLPGGVGYIAFPHLGSDDQLARMEAALAQFPEAKGWILDLRQNTGGDTTVMKPLLGRFLALPRPYAFMRKRQGTGLGPEWRENLVPRAPRVEAPLAVLVSPWTQSVAETLAMAVQGTGLGRVFGTRTAGLDAAVRSLHLKHSKLRVQVSVEPVYDLQHQPRSRFRPLGLIDLATAAGGDPVLQAALAWMAAGAPQSHGPRF